MAKMNSKFKYMLDAAPAITLRAKSAAAITATADSAVYALEQLDGYWNTEEELADQTFAVVVNVDALDTANADETYVLTLVFGDDAAFSNSVTTHTLTLAGTGQHVFLVDFDTVRALLSDATHMKITATLGGTTPSLDYHAFIAGAIIR
ncbi:putative minor capsid protein [Erythrobacter phage vB_EliS-L02]|nr:putative minor capsid protein [Erythrobacter phage vB_EliS-L02]